MLLETGPSLFSGTRSGPCSNCPSVQWCDGVAEEALQHCRWNGDSDFPEALVEVWPDWSELRVCKFCKLEFRKINLCSYKGCDWNVCRSHDKHFSEVFGYLPTKGVMPLLWVSVLVLLLLLLLLKNSVNYWSYWFLKGLICMTGLFS